MIGIEGIVGGDGRALVPGHGAAPRRVFSVPALFGGDWRRAGGEEKSMGEGASEMVTREGKPSQLESEPDDFGAIRITVSCLGAKNL